MTAKEIYNALENLKAEERKNLKEVLEQHGGEYHFEADKPIVAVSQLYSWEGRACDMVVYAAKVDNDAEIYLYGYENGCEDGMATIAAIADDMEGYKVNAREVFVGQMEFIISEII